MATAKPKAAKPTGVWRKADVPYADHDGIRTVPGWSMGGNFGVAKPGNLDIYRVVHIPSGLSPGLSPFGKLKNAKALAEMAAGLLPADLYGRQATDPGSLRPDEIERCREAGRELRLRYREIELK